MGTHAHKSCAYRRVLFGPTLYGRLSDIIDNEIYYPQNFEAGEAAMADGAYIRRQHMVNSQMLLEISPGGVPLMAMGAAMGTSSHDGVAQHMQTKRGRIVASDLANRAKTQVAAAQRIRPVDISVVPHMQHEVRDFPKLGVAAQALEITWVGADVPESRGHPGLHIPSSDVHVRKRPEILQRG